ncbi:hypothetical protein VTK56DRAFT_5343 [Thermocarpiscus australiensis]
MTGDADRFVLGTKLLPEENHFPRKTDRQTKVNKANQIIFFLRSLVMAWLIVSRVRTPIRCRQQSQSLPFFLPSSLNPTYLASLTRRLQEKEHLETTLSATIDKRHFNSNQRTSSGIVRRTPTSDAHTEQETMDLQRAPDPHNPKQRTARLAPTSSCVS